MDKKENIEVAEVASLLGVGVARAASLLVRLGVEVDDRDCVSSQQVVDAIDDAGRLRASVRSIGQQNARDASPEEATRQRLVDLLGEHGLRLVGRAQRNGALLVCKTMDGNQVRIFSYVTNSIRKTGQVGFQVRHIQGDIFDWAAFCAAPLGKFFLKPVDEILARSQGSVVPWFNVSYSEKSHLDDFDNRISELVESVGGRREDDKAG